MEHSDTQISLDQMPELIIEVLAQYLSNKDLVACCAVSRGWREAFDIKPVWKPRYDEERVRYLLKTPCRVDLPFVHLDTHTSLSPMSEWRAAFTVENHFLNNWRQGKYEKENISNLHEIRESSGRFFHGDIFLYPCGIKNSNFLNSDYILVTFKDKIDIFDVRNYPVTQEFESIPIKLHRHYKVVGVNNMILILLRKAVLVYDLTFSTKKWRIKHALIIDEPASFTCTNRIKSLNCKERISAASFITEHFYIGFLKSDTTMHIWNFETGLKLKEEVSPIKSCTFEDIKTSKTNLIIVVKQKGNNSSFFLAYDLSKLMFLPFKKVTQSIYYEYCVSGDYFAIWSDCKLNIYNYKTNKIKLSNYPLQTYQLKSLGYDIVFLDRDTLNVFNHYSGAVKILLSNVVSFEVLSNKFIHILLKRDIGLLRNPKGNVFEVMSSNILRKTSLVLEFKSSKSEYFLNKYATRYIVTYQIGYISSHYILHFW